MARINNIATCTIKIVCDLSVLYSGTHPKEGKGRQPLTGESLNKVSVQKYI